MKKPEIITTNPHLETTRCYQCDRETNQGVLCDTCREIVVVEPEKNKMPHQSSWTI